MYQTGRFQRFLTVIGIAALCLFVSPFHKALAASFTVTTTTDADDGTCDANCTLREAINAANALAGTDTITIPAGTYTLSLGGLPTISTSMNIVGAGADVTTISGATLYRPFLINSGTTVSISGVKITSGRGDYGGGIFGAGTLTLDSVAITDNSASSFGGALWMNGGTLTIRSSTISNNVGFNIGGLAIASTTTMYLINTTMTGNFTPSSGGALYNSGTSYIINSTIVGNTATNFGDNLLNSETLTVRNSIVANSAAGNNCYGAVTDGGHNIDSGTSCNFSISSLSNVNPLVGALAYNGGPTQTMAVLPGSPAINNGSNALALDPVSPLTTDQRGAGFPRINNTTVEIGAYEAALSSLNVQLTLQGRSAPAPDPSRVVTTHVRIMPPGGGTPFYTQDFVTDGSSAFTIPNLPTGTYLFSFKGTHTLARQYTITINAGSNSKTTDLLLEGDSDDKNTVTITDFAILAAAFGTAQGNPSYDARADFNADNAITILDFSLLAANFGLAGDGGAYP